MKKYTLELADGPGVLERALTDAADGEVVYLRRSDRVVAALVPPDVAAAGMAAIDAAEQVSDLRLGESLLADLRDGMKVQPLAELRRELS